MPQVSVTFGLSLQPMLYALVTTRLPVDGIGFIQLARIRTRMYILSTGTILTKVVIQHVSSTSGVASWWLE